MSVTQRQPAAVVGPMIRAKIAAGESVLLLVTGRSMTPLFRDGRDAVILSRVTAWPPKRGSILFAQRADGSYVLHRAIRIVGEACVFNGDGQLWLEAPITRDMVIAEVTAFRRKGKMCPVTHPVYRLYVRAWMAMRPLRRIVFRCYRALKGGRTGEGFA